MPHPTHILHRQIGQDLPFAVAGDGCYLIDAQGKRYLDGSSGAAVSCLGHSNSRVIEAIRQQAGQLAFAHSAFFTSEPAERLAEFLSHRAPLGIEHAYFVCGGSEAMESALKLARQYFVERGEPGRNRFVARRQSYHGNTLGALSVGDNRWRRRVFEPLLTPCHHISPSYPYRDLQEGESLDSYGQRIADELAQTLDQVGAERVIGFVAETVGGATGGVMMPVPGYWRRIREICDAYGILLILDEVMCGMGRTGSLFACEQENVQPDIVAIGKGLGGGYQPIGAMLCSEGIFATIREGSGALLGGHTYLAHPTACAAALAVQETIEDEDLLQRVRQQGSRLEAGLRERLTDLAHVGDIRGRGLFWGIELVRDKTSKACFDPRLQLPQRIKECAMEAGLICYPAAGTVDGSNGVHVLLAPPFIISDGEIDELIGKLHVAIERAIEDTGAER